MEAHAPGRELVAAYLRSLERRGRSPHTRKTYAWGLQRWLDHADLRAPVSWDADLVEGWLLELRRERLSPRSAQTAAAALKGLLRWAPQHGGEVLPNLVNAVESIRLPRLLPRPLLGRYLDRLVAHFAPPAGRAARAPSPLIWWRNRALFVTLVTTGARVSEVLQMPRQLPEEIWVHQKGGHDRPLRLGALAGAAIVDYVSRRDDESPVLWVSSTRLRQASARALSPHGVGDIWRRTARALGIPPFTTHQLRHTCASELAEAGLPDELIADHLGHRDVRTVHGYRELRAARRAIAMEAIEARIAAVTPAPHAPQGAPRYRAGIVALRRSRPDRRPR